MVGARVPALFRQANREFRQVVRGPVRGGGGRAFRWGRRGFLAVQGRRRLGPSAPGTAPRPPGRLPLQEEEEEEEEEGPSGCAESALHASPGLGTSRGRRPPPEAPARAEGAAAAPASRRSPEPDGPRAARVALAAKEMERLMGEFGVDLATVTQAFLKNSGEVAAVASCLRTGRRPDGRPLWSRRDDEDLLECPEGARSHLEAKYGAGNVRKRRLFRRLCRE